VAAAAHEPGKKAAAVTEKILICHAVVLNVVTT
jgi:hypothetical protein